MKLVVGLGNPGEKYAPTRHNVGFMAVDIIVNELSSADWQKKFDSLINFQPAAEYTILFAKPLTYMNLSGNAVQSITNFYRISPEDLIVLTTWVSEA